MTGVICLALVSVLLIHLGKWRLFAPTTVIGIFNLLFLVTKFLWNSAYNEPLLLSCTESEVTSATLALTASLLIGILILVFLRPLLGPKVLGLAVNKKLDLLTRANPLIFAVPIITTSVYLAFQNGIQFLLNPVLNRKTIEANGAAYAYAVALACLLLVGVKIGDAFAAKQYNKSLIVSLLSVVPYMLLSGYASTPLLFMIGAGGSYVIQKKLYLVWVPFVLFPLILLYATIHNTLRQTWATGDAVRIADFVSNEIDLRDAVPRLFNRLDYLEMLSLGYDSFKNSESEGLVKFAEVLIQPIPRSIWPNKPYNFSSEMSRRVIPDVVHLIGSTANFNALNEFVRAIGEAGGIIVFGLFLGVLLSVADLIYAGTVLFSAYRLFYLVVIFPYIWIGYPAGMINDFALPYVAISLLFLTFLAKINKAFNF